MVKVVLFGEFDVELYVDCELDDFVGVVVVGYEELLFS